MGKLKDLYKSYTDTTIRALLAGLDAAEDLNDLPGEAGIALAEELERRWDEADGRTKATIKAVALGALGAAGCAGLAAVIVKTSAASAGAAAPGWVAWIASSAGKKALANTCGLVVTAAVAWYTYSDSDDSGSGGSSQQPTPDPDDPDGDYDGDGTTSRDELAKADQKLWDEEITPEEYMRIWYKYACDQGDTSYCGK
ncbi:hypothetical protein [Candidatus Poriferisodalis sp.]|uniref:hypothetical protein n=1 Tax=Candidatus Poriferisodalis sp. TaxID=3101277 RepID=UPI003B5CD120